MNTDLIINGIKVPAEMRTEFYRFIETGDASPNFMKFLENNEQVRKGLDAILRNDEVRLGR